MIRRLSTLMLVALIATVLIPRVPPAYAQDTHDHVQVAIDIKPGSDPNAINIRRGVEVPVAVLGSDSFDVETVQAETVKFGPMHQDDAGATALRWAFEDVNSDGFMDLVFHFKAEETGLKVGDMQACLHGTLDNGQDFCGHDTVKVIG